MIRNFNYTNRTKIDRANVQIVMRPGDDGVSQFDAELKLGELGLPDSAEVYVEAYYKSSYMRFHYGSVGNIFPPTDRRLTEIDSETASFRVKVVDQSGLGKMLLALADNLAPEQTEPGTGGRRSLLPVKFAEDLGDEIWQLLLEPEPTLLVNRNVEGIREVVKTSKEFLGLVFPEVIRQILRHIAAEYDMTEASRDWWGLWMMFMTRYVPLPENFDSDDDGMLNDWIDRAVAMFCTRHNIKNEFRKARLTEVISSRGYAH